MKKKFRIDDCGIFPFKQNKSNTGEITSISYDEIPFEVKRAFYLYGIPDQSERGNHAHKELDQIIVAVSGSFEILLDDGFNSKTVLLNRSDIGLHLRPGIWKKMFNFSGGAVILSLTSHNYDETDYLRNYADFKHYFEIDN